MALSFVAGVVQNNSGLCALAIASCALAGLCEAITEVHHYYGPSWLVPVQHLVTYASWLATATAGLFAILSFI
jgi:hypothetical protein